MLITHYNPNALYIILTFWDGKNMSEQSGVPDPENFGTDPDP
jgi:hypothetical protein